MELVLLAAAVAAGAVAQSVSGIGFVLVCGPALVGVLGASDGVALSLLLNLLLNAAVLVREWAQVRWRDALLLFVPAALTTPLWARLLHGLDRGTEARAAGVVVLVGVLLLVCGLRARRLAGPAGALLGGAVSSAMNVAAAASGPAVALFATNAGWGHRDTRATLQAYFLALNLVAIATLGLPSVSASAGLTAAAGLAAGTAGGAVLAPRVRARQARAATLALAALGAVVLLLTG